MSALQGFTPYPHELEAQIFAASGDLTKSELLLLMLILRYTAGYHREACELSYGDIGKALGFTRKSIAKAIRGLEAKKIVFKRCGEKSNIYQVNYDFPMWKSRIPEDTSIPEETSIPEYTSASIPEDTPYLLKEKPKERTTTTPKQRKKPVEKWKIPALQEVVAYAKEVGQSEALAEKFWQYYQLTGWKTKGGAAVEDWKSGFLFWMASERKHLPKASPKPTKPPKSDNAEAYKGLVYNLDRWDDSGIAVRTPSEAVLEAEG